ncbi:MAG: hypothetical protein Ct9H300mP14_06010 [Gammaproteobacteria bacterium]|nr:MAG: hypothetical protein Ct9H300mP14_06010 [Gammaproteobacteria bacterium]
MKYLRRPLTFSFVLTLSLLRDDTAHAFDCIYLQKGLSPHCGTLLKDPSVAQGDYGKQLPVTSGDKLGVLVSSFNRMTQEIAAPRPRCEIVNLKQKNKRLS